MLDLANIGFPVKFDVGKGSHKAGLLNIYRKDKAPQEIEATRVLLNIYNPKKSPLEEQEVEGRRSPQIRNTILCRITCSTGAWNH